MKFLESISSFWEKGATFTGTASRSEYWWVQLFLFACYMLIFGIVKPESEDFICLLFEIVVFIPSLALTIRRFNDIKLSILIPIVALSLVMFFDILSFGMGEYLEDTYGFWEFLASNIDWFINGVCLVPSATKTTNTKV